MGYSFGYSSENWAWLDTSPLIELQFSVDLLRSIDKYHSLYFIKQFKEHTNKWTYITDMKNNTNKLNQEKSFRTNHISSPADVQIINYDWKKAFSNEHK